MREHFTTADLRAERLPKGLVVQVKLGRQDKQLSFPDEKSRDTVIYAVRRANGLAEVVHD